MYSSHNVSVMQWDNKDWFLCCSFSNIGAPSAAVAVCLWGVWPGGVWPGRVSAHGGVCPGGCLSGGVSARHTPPVNRITDRCKNINLPHLCCGR